MTNVIRYLHARRWLLAPLVSSALLVASAYVSYLWPLGFIALAPFFVLTERMRGSVRRIASSAFLIGFLYPLALLSVTVMEFTWLPDAHFFESVVRLMALPIALVVGALYAGAYAFYAARLQTRSLLKNVFLFSAVWALMEWVVTVGTGGFNLGVLAYVAAPLPLLTSLAALGGTHFVSFLVILINAFFGALFFAFRRGRTHFLHMLSAAAVTLLALTLLSLGNTYYLHRDQTTETLTVAVLQNSNRTTDAFGTFGQNGFSFPKLTALIQEAKRTHPAPDLIVYPFAVAKEILSTGAPSLSVATGPLSAFAAWERATVGTSTLVTWNTIDRNETFWNEIDYWQNGSVVASYDKRTLMPFIDYTPLWAERSGFYSTVIDETAGDAQSLVPYQHTQIANAVCSEIDAPSTVRKNLRGAGVAFSIGSDAMFDDSFASRSDLLAAQFRAAENNVPIVRANRFGPSGFISADGRMLRATAPDTDGVFIGALSYELHPRPTLYSVTGDALFVLLSIIFLGWFTRKGRASRDT